MSKAKQHSFCTNGICSEALDTRQIAPDLGVFRLFSRTRPHKFRGRTFWKVIFSAFGHLPASLTIAKQQIVTKKGSNGYGPV